MRRATKLCRVVNKTPRFQKLGDKRHLQKHLFIDSSNEPRIKQQATESTGRTRWQNHMHIWGTRQDAAGLQQRHDSSAKQSKILQTQDDASTTQRHNHWHQTHMRYFGRISSLLMCRSSAAVEKTRVRQLIIQEPLKPNALEFLLWIGTPSTY